MKIEKKNELHYKTAMKALNLNQRHAPFLQYHINQKGQPNH